MRVWVVTVAVLLALLLGAGWYGSAQHTRAVAAESRADGLTSKLEASVALTKRIQQGVQRVERERNQAQHDLAKALADNREWADSPVPEPVRIELCKRIRCTGVQPVPTPAR
ncbi:putative Rz-like protein [Pseudomonas phage MR6]|uniref:Putative Rz-like protein n=1 Tax=Pseudomonas phage MR5 TaxID=2711172 RepID=A0A6M3TCR6_9CAUD|nr:putative Rz-like protein [Pseudomonas phage MR5]QJD54880.1 putative Rz-like protein [Pseudomonas phage MR6]QJD54941.1 putative Rz-like protein [Pseudomonas phage MR7]QJD54998.1 hypothetical protein PssvBMR8_gp50 [Pseudomonas phage MR8]QJD55055.1 hypothetical protein PssvBMR12_gp50 [Pseudomonas phage MR12]QJD55358.1 hypothetical protein PssvBMR18_gp50 [Pseudomonas phage MR18]QJF74622.1 putative Rz-like protein [Pseudomonas phage MR16]